VQTQITVRGEARRSASGDSSGDDQAWAEVRAEAVNAAIDKARDYAAALGGTITGIEHVADHEPAGVTLPQELHAVVELRCLATVGPVSEQSRRWIDPGQVRPTASTGGSISAVAPGVPAAPDESPRRPRPARY